MKRLNGRTAVVTGGARNIGAVLCCALAREGANVVVADIRDPSETVNACKEVGVEAVGVSADVSEERSVDALIAETVDVFGTVDVLVCNAGLYGDLAPSPIDGISTELWDRTMAINLKGVFLCAKAALPFMRKKRRGSIITISSGTVFNGFGGAHYVASKAGVIGLTRVIAREAGADNIRANAITPGFTLSKASTDLIEKYDLHRFLDGMVASTPLGRAEQPDDLVGATLFLASDDSSFVTGQILNVDGGAHML
jgi:NAD(P)-dependent dehydrogenase (short-subunit alcohol dehydrogenase family)